MLNRKDLPKDEIYACLRMEPRRKRLCDMGGRA